MDVPAFVKGFSATDEVKKVKENLGDFRAWCAEYKKQKEATVSYFSKQGSQEPEDRPAGSRQQLPTWRGRGEPLLEPSLPKHRRGSGRAVCRCRLD